MQAFFSGITIGLFLGLMTGPVFFRLIQTSVNYGFRKALFFSFGVSFSDWIYATLAYFGLSSLLENEQVVFWMGKAGGGVLIALGISSLFTAFRRKAIEYEVGAKGFFSGNTFLQGFLINIFSPFVIFFWVAIVTLGRVRFNIIDAELVYYLLGALSTILIMDTLKSYLADKIRNILTPKFLSIVNIIIGIALLVFGFSLLFISLDDISTQEMMDNMSFNPAIHS
ncbi:MAG: LysE family translocator [Bacteroidota bacterium]